MAPWVRSLTLTAGLALLFASISAQRSEPATVFVRGDDGYYHLSTCPFVRGRAGKAMPVDTAVAAGLGECPICSPASDPRIAAALGVRRPPPRPTTPSSSALPTISASQAARFIGRPVAVEDAVAQVSREPQSGFTYLNFGGEFPRHVFRAIIPAAVERLIPPDLLQGGRILVRGVPQQGPFGAEIMCVDASQVMRPGTALTAAPSNASMTEVPAAATPGAATPALPVAAVPTPSTTTPALPVPATSGCCRYCSTGKPCGNACIPQSQTCRLPAGCAC
jgi:hypothetical protein